MSTAVRGVSARRGDARRDRVRRVVKAVREVEEEGNDHNCDEGQVLDAPPSQAFFMTMLAITFAAVSQASSARSSPS